jgi:hypothetical protein
MKKVSLAVLGMYFSILSSFSQNSQTADTFYKKRNLKIDEINIVSSYYNQDGNNATTSGGIGSQKLTDVSTSIDLKLIGYDKRNRKHSFTAELGFDHYTSASSDKIDPSTISSASRNDRRIYPSIGWAVENENKGTTAGAGLYYSTEYDYQSVGMNLNFSKKTKKRDGEFTVKIQTYIDEIGAVYPIEFRTRADVSNSNFSRNTFAGSVSWSQIINRNLQVLFETEAIYQKGLLSLPFHRVYFADNSVHLEKLPSTRLKVPIGFRANYFLGDYLIIRGWYRHYRDDWNIRSNTFQVETSIKIDPFFSITPFYRFYEQSAADHFAPFALHTSSEFFYTSNYDLSKFNSHFFGAGLRLVPPDGVFKIQHWNALELRYGRYRKSIDLQSNIISMHLKFK